MVDNQVKPLFGNSSLQKCRRQVNHPYSCEKFSSVFDIGTSSKQALEMQQAIHEKNEEMEDSTPSTSSLVRTPSTSSIESDDE